MKFENWKSRNFGYEGMVLIVYHTKAKRSTNNGNSSDSRCDFLTFQIRMGPIAWKISEGMCYTSCKVIYSVFAFTRSLSMVRYCMFLAHYLQALIVRNTRDIPDMKHASRNEHRLSHEKHPLVISCVTHLLDACEQLKGSLQPTQKKYSPCLWVRLMVEQHEYILWSDPIYLRILWYRYSVLRTPTYLYIVSWQSVAPWQSANR